MLNILLSAATVLLAGTTFVGSARAAELPKGAAHNIVLVHGAFVDQTSWQPVANILTKKGYNVTLVENPLTSLAADVDATKQALAKQDGKTVLVGHSWGGVVITEAGNDPKVSALVYVAARAPDAGEDYGALAATFPTPPASAGLVKSGGFAQLSEESFLRDFASDIEPAKARVLYAEQGRISATLFASRTTQAAWKSKPSWYAVSTQDRTTNTELQRFLSKRMKATTIELASGHLSLLSHPDEVTALILAAAGRHD